MLGTSRLLKFCTSSVGITNRLLLTLTSPSEAIFLRAPVDAVSLPGTEGYFTVTNNHSQTVTQLRNGVVTVRASGKPDAQYFLSDGFLFYKNSDPKGCCTAEVVAVELIPLSMLDKEKTAEALQEVLQGQQTDNPEWDKAKKQLGQELCASIFRVAS